MFPVLTVTLFRLQPGVVYDVTLDMVPVDGLRYRYSYHRSRWLPTAAGRVDSSTEIAMEESAGDVTGPTAPYRHPSCPLSCCRSDSREMMTDSADATCQSLRTNTLTFDRLKLTNCRSTGNSQVRNPNPNRDCS